MMIQDTNKVSSLGLCADIELSILCFACACEVGSFIGFYGLYVCVQLKLSV